MKLPADVIADILARPGVTDAYGRPLVPACGDTGKSLNSAIGVRYRRHPQLADAAYSLIVVVPIQVRSEANLRNWRGRSRRTQEARTAWTATVLRFRLVPPPLPAIVTFTRFGGQRMDDDNLRGAIKGLRDHVAAWIGCDDADPRIQWEYDQMHGKVGVQVEIRPLTTEQQ